MKPRTEKQVQIPLRLLYDLFDILDGLEPILSDQIHPADVEYIQGAKREIKAKFDAMERHALFSAYKGAEQGTAEREAYRIRYLDSAGIHQDWRSDKETEV